MDKREGGLATRRLSIPNKVLLGKWCWRFSIERDSFWKKVIIRKYGKKEGGWRFSVVRDRYKVGVCKVSRSRWEAF